MSGSLARSSGSEMTVGVGVLRLLQICSPAFPIGAFAYSQGLEQAAELGWVHDASTLQDWLCGMLNNSLARTDMPLLRLGYQLWQHGQSDCQLRAEHLCQTVLAYRETFELRTEEQHMGRALARVLTHLGLDEAATFVERDDAAYLPLFALAAVRFDIAEVDMLAGFAFSWCENQVSAASRVIRIGQLGSQGVLSKCLNEIPQAVARSAQVDEDEIGYCPPGMFLASAWHEEQYSRLFRS